MSITREELRNIFISRMQLRKERLLQKTVDQIKHDVLILNELGKTTYKSVPKIYDASLLKELLERLKKLFNDSDIAIEVVMFDNIEMEYIAIKIDWTPIII